MNNESPNEEHWMLLVLLLREICEERNISQQELAETTGLKQSNISRLFALKYCPNLRTYMTVADALGLNVYFTSREGAGVFNTLKDSD